MLSTNDDDWSTDDEDFGSHDEWEDMEVSGDGEFDGLKEEFDCRKCVFCLSGHYCNSFEECLQHMSTCHTFFIPYDNLLGDAEALICYLRKQNQLCKHDKNSN